MTALQLSLRLGILAGFLFGGFALGWLVQGWRAEAKLNAVQAKHSQDLTAAQASAIAIANAESERTAKAAQAISDAAQEVLDDLQLAQARIQHDRAVLDADRDRLLNAYRRTPAQRCPDPGNTADVAAAEQAELVRTELFRSLQNRATELVGAVDEQHSYAASCVARYRKVADELKKLQGTGEP